MLRVLLLVVSVGVAGLAFVLGQAWLYGVAGVFLIAVLILLAGQAWRAYEQSDFNPQPPSDRRDESLEDFGIMNVQPQTEDPGASDARGEETHPVSAAGGADEGASVEPTGGVRTAEDPVSSTAEEAALSSPSSEAAETRGAPSADAASRSEETTDQPVLGPFLESLRAALQAGTVALLVQEDVALEYRISALATVHTQVRRTGTFETHAPLLTATMSRQSVSVEVVDDEGRMDLGYYETVPPVRQVALAPVDQEEGAETVFLVADAEASVDLDTPRSRSLLRRYADLVGPLREGGPSDADGIDGRGPEPDGGSTSPRPAERTGQTDDSPRPRREIIAEEITDAEDAAEKLALVLVHLNRAESIARRGDEAVASAEEHLRTRLEHLAPGQRVERFGELTYGIFVRGGAADVEPWAVDLQSTMAQETGELEGGVSVGVAVRQAQHDAEALRAAATKALLEAYETGTCTIVA